MSCTAWLTTQANMTVTGERCEVTVTEDEASGGPEPVPATALRVPTGDDSDAMAAAENVLSASGWVTEGEWEQYDHGYTIAVRRADAKHVLQGVNPIKARYLHGGE